VHAAAIKLLPQGTPALAGTPTQMAGWGFTTPGGITSSVLLKADVPIIDYAECQNLYDGTILPSEICAGTAENSMDACGGDDGGALVYNGTLIGIATYGNTCGVAGQPGIYTDAARYTDWISYVSGVNSTDADESDIFIYDKLALT
jgi:trypsin